MAKAVAVLLILVGLINFLPVLGVLSAERLSQAYSVALSDSNLIILMRHRALLFGLLGGFILFSVLVPLYRPAAMLLAAISMVGFLVFMFLEGGYNEALHKVMIADVVGIVALGAAALLHYLS